MHSHLDRSLYLDVQEMALKDMKLAWVGYVAACLA